MCIIISTQSIKKNYADKEVKFHWKCISLEVDVRGGMRIKRLTLPPQARWDPYFPWGILPRGVWSPFRM